MEAVPSGGGALARLGVHVGLLARYDVSRLRRKDGSGSGFGDGSGGAP